MPRSLGDRQAARHWCKRIADLHRLALAVEKQRRFVTFHAPATTAAVIGIAEGRLAGGSRRAVCMLCSDSTTALIGSARQAGLDTRSGLGLSRARSSTAKSISKTTRRKARAGRFRQFKLAEPTTASSGRATAFFRSMRRCGLRDAQGRWTFTGRALPKPLFCPARRRRRTTCERTAAVCRAY